MDFSIGDGVATIIPVLYHGKIVSKIGDKFQIKFNDGGYMLVEANKLQPSKE